MRVNNKLQRLAEPGGRLYLIFLVAFAAATLFFKNYMLAAAEAAMILLLLIYSHFARRRRKKQLAALIEEVTYDTENAKNNTLMNFPLPIAVFRLDDSRIVWGNDMFFGLDKNKGSRVDARISDLVPSFNGKWLLEGKNRYRAFCRWTAASTRSTGILFALGARRRTAPLWALPTGWT